MNLRSTKFALLFGAINGFLFAVAFQFVSNAFLDYENNRPSEISIESVKVISPLGESLFLVFLFVLASYTAHRLFAARVKSTIVLWQIVAIIAVAVPSTVLYIIEKVNRLDLLPDGNDIEFELLLLGLAITVNFFFGAAIAQLSGLSEK